MPQPTLRDWLSIAALGLIWGATFMVIALALRGYGPVTVATARTTLGAVTLWIAVLVLGRPLPRWSARLGAHVLVIGLFSTAFPFFLLSWGQQSVPSAFAGLSMAAGPLFVLPLAHAPVPGEQLSWRKASGFSLGFLGVLVLMGSDALSGSATALPRLACLCAALCYAVASITTRRCPPIDPILLAAFALLVGALALIPAMPWSEGLPRPAGAVPMAAIVILGLVPTALATLIRVQVIRAAGPSFTALTSYQVPLWSFFFGALVLGEVLAPRFFVALGLILAGLTLSHRRR
ncbi:DMT family transporter [Defluviimonas sp. WL0024]|uniref:DMT family transporter n=1 Tax=Albidovulum salinarum TaxID=2984153 RepID=A0ABT2X211_9RHOB|nr:DMT family transporter [Defluviimonas sp. WL0024]MCU9847042.1 DMT family transporter [Defluviimonas sp. WL0024]